MPDVTKIETPYDLIKPLFLEAITALSMSPLSEDDMQEASLVWLELLEDYKQAVSRNPRVLGRTYHNFDHVCDCLRILSKLKVAPLDRARLTLALFYHDSVYFAGQKNNERYSALSAMSKLGAFDISGSDLGKIFDMIMATRHLDVEFTDANQNIICDIDLVSLGSSPEEFIATSDRVIAEFANVPQEAFLEGRIKFLDSLLARKTIYRTAYFQVLYETKARSNLAHHRHQLAEKLAAIKHQTA